MEVLPVIHNVSSAQRLIDMARLSYGLGLKSLVATKVYGGAAQAGVPEVMRMALKAGRGFAVLADLRDFVEVMKPSEILIVSKEHARELIDPASPPVYEGLVALVINGGEPDFSPQEVAVGRPVYIKGIEQKIGAVAEAAILLYSLRSINGKGGQKDLVKA